MLHRCFLRTVAKFRRVDVRIRVTGFPREDIIHVTYRKECRSANTPLSGASALTGATHRPRRRQSEGRNALLNVSGWARLKKWAD